jgi:hypothetical protein
MANKFVSVLETIGKDFQKGLTEVVKFLPAATTLAGFIFPASVAPLESATVVANLLQTAISEAEQKLAAVGTQDGTGPQKLATVITLVTGAVTSLLAEPTVSAALAHEGISVDTTYITNLVNAVVAFLNIQGVTGNPS